jgi:hypothetical protein
MRVNKNYSDTSNESRVKGKQIPLLQSSTPKYMYGNEIHVEPKRSKSLLSAKNASSKPIMKKFPVKLKRKPKLEFLNSDINYLNTNDEL